MPYPGMYLVIWDSKNGGRAPDLDLGLGPRSRSESETRSGTGYTEARSGGPRRGVPTRVHYPGTPAGPHAAPRHTALRCAVRY